MNFFTYFFNITTTVFILVFLIWPMQVSNNQSINREAFFRINSPGIERNKNHISKVNIYAEICDNTIIQLSSYLPQVFSNC
jgi:hypothetical protein